MEYVPIYIAIVTILWIYLLWIHGIISLGIKEELTEMIQVL